MNQAEKYAEIDQTWSFQYSFQAEWWCETKFITKNSFKSLWYWNFIYQTHKNNEGNTPTKNWSDNIFTNKVDFKLISKPSFC